MKRPIAVVSLLVCLALALTAVAQVSGLYDLSWHVIGGGGGRMESPGGHQLRGTAGQSLVGTMRVGSGHSLCSGYWRSSAGERFRAFLPLVARRTSARTLGSVFRHDVDGGRRARWTLNRPAGVSVDP